MVTLTRYDELSTSSTPLDPLEDAAGWISSLRSRAYTGDLLRTTHGVSGVSETNRLTRAIDMYARNALGFLDQAYSGPPEVSFLPLYYAVLNLSKVTILASGLEADLNKQRWHGAAYRTSNRPSHGLLTESITLHAGGAFPLLYRALTGAAVGFKQRSLAMGEVYSLVSGVTYEYGEAFSKRPARQMLSFDVESRGSNRFRLLVTAHHSPHPDAGKLRFLQAIRGFRSVPGKPGKFASSSVIAKTPDAALKELRKKVNRFLLYNIHLDATYAIQGVDTPLSAAMLHYPEEVPIWLSLFHLSSIVRYNPEFLAKLENSKAWPLLYGLRRHSVFRYLMLFWSQMHKRQFHITVT